MPDYSYILLPSKNLATAATKSVSGVSADSLYGLANLSDGDVTLPFMATGAGAARLIFDCTDPVQVDGAFLPMANIAAGTVVKWEGHTSNSWGAPDVSVTITIPTFATLRTGMTPIPESVWANVIAAYPDAGTRTKRYWSLSVAAFASALKVGELIFGELDAVPPRLLVDDTEQQGYQDVIKEAPQGRRWGFRYAIRRRHLSGTLVTADEETRTLWRALEDEVGLLDPFIYVPWSDENRALLVALDATVADKPEAPDIFRLPISVTEVNRGLPL